MRQKSNFLNNLYRQKTHLTPEEYKFAQRKLIISEASASSLFVFTSGTFFIGFLTMLGASSQYSAIIIAIPQLGCIMQLLSPYIFERLQHRKLLICISCFLFRFLVGTVIFVPYMIKDTQKQLITIMIIYTISFLIAGFVTPGLNNWKLSLAPQKNRGQFFAIKDITSMILSGIVIIGIGRMLDYYELMDNALMGFTIMFGISLVWSVLDFLFISTIKEPLEAKLNKKPKLYTIITTPLKDPVFRSFILFLSLWSFAIQLSISFIPIYILNELGFSYSFISGITIASNMINILAIWGWGKLADKTSWHFLLKASGWLIAVCYLSWFWVTKNNGLILVPLLQILLTCSNGAFNMANLNLQYGLSPATGKTTYFGITAAIASTISFGGALVGSYIYGLLKPLEFTILSISVGSTQILFAISGFLLTLALLYREYVGS